MTTSTQTLYRATDTEGIAAGTCFAATVEAAAAYLDNSGYGGSTLYSVAVAFDASRVADIDTFRGLAEALVSVDVEAAAALFDVPTWGYDYDDSEYDLSDTTIAGCIEQALSARVGWPYELLESNSDVRELLAQSYDWAVYTDSYPEDCTTYQALRTLNGVWQRLDHTETR